jgi:hypothetical protein
MLNAPVGLKGRWKLEVYRPDGRLRETREFDNLITDAGLDAIGTRLDTIKYHQVGTGSATPAVTDTSLAQWLASGSSRQSHWQNVSQDGTTSEWRSGVGGRWRFNPGVAEGNISEVGAGWATSGNLFSRALILDELDQPTTMTILSDEYLDTTYACYVYPKNTDTTGQFELDSVTYDYVIRPADMDSTSYITHRNPYNADLYEGVGLINRKGRYGTMGSAYTSTATLGSIIAYPGGTNDMWTSVANQAYVPGSYERIGNCFADLNDCNMSGGIGACTFIFGNMWQASFSPALPKNSTKQLTIVWKVSWARRP